MTLEDGRTIEPEQLVGPARPGRSVVITGDTVPCNSIVELAVSVPIHFVIADGIDAMEGNGPLHGPMRHLGCLVFADDPVAADATCCRLMGIDPGRVRHLQMASALGNLDTSHIEQRGETVESVAQQFGLIPQFAHLRG